MADYKISIKRTLKHEDPTLSGKVTSDTGGLTRWGISQKAFPKLNIAKLTLLEAMEIYKRYYFNPLKLEEVQDQNVADVIFDFGVNAGLHRAIMILQQVLDVKIDSKIGPMTINTLNKKGPAEFISEYTKERISFYISLASRQQFAPYIRGWIKRAKSYLEEGQSDG
jgi:lysozyme family protein